VQTGCRDTTVGWSRWTATVRSSGLGRASGGALGLLQEDRSNRFAAGCGPEPDDRHRRGNPAGGRQTGGPASGQGLDKTALPDGFCGVTCIEADRYGATGFLGHHQQIDEALGRRRQGVLGHRTPNM